MTQPPQGPSSPRERDIPPDVLAEIEALRNEQGAVSPTQASLKTPTSIRASFDHRSSTPSFGTSSESLNMTEEDREWREWNEWKAFLAWKEIRARRERAQKANVCNSPLGVGAGYFGEQLGQSDNRPNQPGFPLNAGDAEDSPAGLPKYLVSQTGRTTGWAAMAQVVRDFDVEKIDDVRDDIDTLLVFAGLFSAVLSAFLIAVYPSLQPDSTDQSLVVLERIATQTASYTLQGGALTSTALSPASPPPFQPAPSDVLANSLWFASLVISLVTASFGMLVKQWLREYLAVENPSPQARLRVRHLRYPELRKWKVLEIAAALPLLLQIALGLFFAGLCVLTSSLNSDVNKSTLPLVAGWALCFLAVTIMPVFYPLCPFKTTFLKSPLQLLRRAIVLGLYLLYMAILSPTVFLMFIPGFNPNILIPRLIGKIVSRAVNGRDDEAEAVSNEDADVDMLAAVDAIQSNDELLSSTIVESLEQVQPAFEKALDFALKVLQNRLQAGTFVGMPPAVLDLRTLSKRAKGIVVQTLSQYYALSQQQLPQPQMPLLTSVVPPAIPPEQSRETLWMFAILFSPSRIPLAPSGISLLKDVFLPRAPKICYALTASCYMHQPGDEYAEKAGDSRVTLFVQGLTDVLDLVDVDFPTSWGCFRAILMAMFHHVRLTEPGVATNVAFSCDRLHLWLGFVSRDCQEALRTSLFRFLHKALDLLPNTVQRSLTVQPADTLREAVVVIDRLNIPGADMSTSGRLQDHYMAVFKSMLEKRDLTELFIEVFLWPKGGRRQTGLSVPSIMSTLFLTYNSSNSWRTIHANLASAIELRLDLEPPESLKFETTELLDLCSDLVQMVHLFRGLRYANYWRRIFDVISKALKFSARGDVQPQSLSVAAWNIIQAIWQEERSEATLLARDYKIWASSFSPEKTVFSDELIMTLDQFSTHNWHEYPKWRARRRREQQTFATSIYVDTPVAVQSVSTVNAMT